MLSEETRRKISSYLVLAIFFFYKSSESLLQPAVRIYIYEKVCQNEGLPDSICEEHKSKQSWSNEFASIFADKENDVQKKASKYLLAYRILLNVPALFFCLFAGSWSDRVGRKFPMMLPPLGAVCATLLFTVSTMKNTQGLSWILGAAAVYGIFGKSTVMTMACSSYVVDTSSKSERTELLGRLLAMNFFGIFLGSLLTGVMLNFSDMYTIFITVVVVNLILEFTIIFLVRESVDMGTRRVSCLQLFVPCVNIEQKSLTMMDSIGTLFKKRIKQLTLLFLFISLCINQILKQGEQDIILLLVKHAPFNWPGQWYGYYLSVYYACMGINLVVILPLVSRCYEPSDITLVMVGLSAKIVRMIMTALAETTWLLFFSAVIGCFAGFIVSAIKSMVSKIVDEDEIGQTFALLSCSEALASLAGPLIFNPIYAGTVDIFPGMVFAMDAAVHFILLGCFFKLYIEEKRSINDTSGELTPIVNSEHRLTVPSITVQKEADECEELEYSEGRRVSGVSVASYTE